MTTIRQQAHITAFQQPFLAKSHRWLTGGGVLSLKLKFFSILVGNNVFTEKFSFFLYNGCTSKPRCGRQGELQSWMRHDLQQWEAERERERQSLDRFA
jgi:hypothetical protein